jgi:hypothetical protein
MRREDDLFMKLSKMFYNKNGERNMDFGYTIKPIEEDSIILSVSCWVDIINVEKIEEREDFNFIQARMFDGMYEVALAYSEGDFNEIEEFLKSISTEYCGGLMVYGDNMDNI